MPKAQQYEFLDLVWAKLGTYPWWPGQVADPQWCSDAVKKSKPKGLSYCVHFLESNTFSWVKPKDLKPFRCAAYEEYVNKEYKYKGYMEAVALCQQREVDLGRVPPPGFVPADAPKVKQITIKQGGKTVGKTLGKRANSSGSTVAKKKRTTSSASSSVRIQADQATIHSLSEELARWMTASDASGDYGEVLTMFEVLSHFEVSAEVLRSTPLGRRIKRLSKREKYPKAVRDRASVLYTEYSDIIRKDYEMSKNATPGGERSGAKIHLRKKKVQKPAPTAATSPAKRIPLPTDPKPAAAAPAAAAPVGPAKPKLVDSDDESSSAK